MKQGANLKKFNVCFHHWLCSFFWSQNVSNLWSMHEVHLQQTSLQRPLWRPVVLQSIQEKRGALLDQVVFHKYVHDLNVTRRHKWELQIEKKNTLEYEYVNGDEHDKATFCTTEEWLKKKQDGNARRQILALFLCGTERYPSIKMLWWFASVS